MTYSEAAFRKLIWLADMNCAEQGCHTEYAPVYTRIAAHATDQVNDHISDAANEAYWSGANSIDGCNE